MRKFFRIAIKSLASIAGVVILLVIFINLPFSRNLVTGQVNALFRNLELPLNIQTIQSVRLKKVKLEGFSIRDTGGDTIIYVGNLEARVKLMALMKSKVILDEAELNGIVVNMGMDYQTHNLKIAEAFKKDKKKKPADPEKKGSNWEIRIQKGEINSAQFFMEDTLSGIHILNEVQNLKIKRFRLSLLEREIKANSIELRKAKGSVKVSPRGMVKKKAKNRAATPWNFGIKDLSLEKIDFTFEHISDSLLLKLEMDKGILQTRQMDIPGKILDMANISLEGTRGSIYTSQKSGSANDTHNNEIKNFPWNIKTRQANLVEVDLITGAYADLRGESGTEGIGIEGLEMKLRDFQISQIQVGMKLKSLGFNLSNGFALEQMKAELESGPESTSLSMELETGRSQLKLEGEANVGFFDLLKDPTEIQDAYLRVNKSLLSLSDITAFTSIPKQWPVYSTIAVTPTSLSVQMDMKENKLTLSELSLAQHQKFKLSLLGFAHDPFEPSIAKGKIDLALSGINTPWLKELLKASGNDVPISDSTEFSLLASISDTFSAPELSLQLASNLGNIELSGHMDTELKSYSLFSRFEEIHLGRLLGIPILGSLAGSAQIDGSGLSAKTIDSNMDLFIDSVAYNGYTYVQTHIESRLLPGDYELLLQADDPAFSSSLAINALKTDSLISAKATGTLTAQLEQLYFFPDTLAVRSDLTATLIKEPHAIKTGVSLQDIRLSSPSESTELQKVDAQFSSDTSRTTLTGAGDFFQMDLLTEKSMDELAGFGLSFINYLKTFTDSSRSVAAQRVSELPAIYASGNINYHQALDILMQDTSLYVSDLHFSILHEPVHQQVKYNIEGSGIRYKTARLNEVEVQLVDSAGILNLDAFADSSSLFSGPPSSFLVSAHSASFKGLAALTILNQNVDTIYNIEIGAVIDSNHIVLNIPSQHLILNHETWHLDSSRFLTINLDSFKLYPELYMRTDSSLLHLSTDGGEGRPDYRLRMDQVKLSSLLWDDLSIHLAEGYMSGEVDVTLNDPDGKRIDTELSIHKASYSDIKFDHIFMDAFLSIGDSGQISTRFSAELDSATIKVEGENILAENRYLWAEYAHIPLKTIQPFTTKYLSEMEGFVSGNFKELATAGANRFTGEMAFDAARLKVVPLNSTFTIPDQSIQFEDDRIVLNDFRIEDTLRSSLLVDGYLDFRERPFRTDLNITSSKLQLMNTTEADNETFFGSLFVDSDITFSGPVYSPDIDAKILLARGTRLNLSSKDNLDMTESSQLVNFTSQTETDEASMGSPIPSQKLFHMSSIKTIIEIDPSTQINFHLSKRIFNIKLQIKGGGSLNYNVLNNNQVSLSGKYGISEGSAELDITGWPNKYFVISKGGYVNWDGNVEDPELKFEAISKVSTSYANPVDGKVRNVDVNVVLILSQHLSDLNILFTINTADQYLMSIINTLSPEEQMRQAITILLFEIIDLPGISTSSDYVSQQASQILANQLNQLTKSTIKGVDISFGIDTYTHSVQGGGESNTTALSYEVKKSLLNNRAKIEVSGRIQNTNEVPGASDQALNNVSFEYQLDSAETKFLKVYNEQSYEDVFEGEVIKTGIGFTYRKPYRTFGDIWKRKNKRDKGNEE